MYNALFDRAGLGSTRLHVDVADAWNVLLHAGKGGADGFAVWIIFRREDAEVVAQFLRDQGISVGPGHPIHLQQSYFTANLLSLLEEKTGVRPYTIHQRQGDMVLIPVGCAHQVRSTFWFKRQTHPDALCRSAIRLTA
jgi:lysine-specific demethylase 3